jgi:hypothetical protein
MPYKVTIEYQLDDVSNIEELERELIDQVSEVEGAYLIDVIVEELPF